MTSPLLVQVPVFSDLGRLALALRKDVHVLEQGYKAADECDEFDFTATHLVAIEDGDVVSTLRLIYLPEHVKIGRVVVRRDMAFPAAPMVQKSGLAQYPMRLR